MSVDVAKVKKDLELTVTGYEANGFGRLEICRRMVRAIQAIVHLEGALPALQKEFAEKEKIFRDFDSRMWAMRLEMAYQMNADHHRIHNQMGTIVQLQDENRRLRDLLRKSGIPH